MILIAQSVKKLKCFSYADFGQSQYLLKQQILEAINGAIIHFRFVW